MKISNYLPLLGMLFLASCEKGLPVGEAPDFDVTAAAATYQTGRPVSFRITGSADHIWFYSGETLNDYAFKDGRVVDLADKGASLSFTSAVQNGTQAGQLSVLVSSDFNGNYDNLAGIKAATWTDITSRFELGTSSTFASSTNQDISDLIQAGKPVYIAFKYLTRPQADNGLARTWMIQGLSLASNTRFNGDYPVLTDQTFAAFRIVDEDPVNTPSRSSVTSTRLTLLGNIYKDPNDEKYNPDNPIYDPKNPIYDPTSELYNPDAVRPEFIPYDPASPYNDPLRETWAVSQPIYTDKADFGPDFSIPVRGLLNPKATEFQYTYSQPGNYKVYFVAANVTSDQSKQVVKELNLTITP